MCARIAVIWEPMWKWRRSTQVSRPRSRSRSRAATISPGVRPNFERSPLESTHLPAPLADRRARIPRRGTTPSSSADLEDALELRIAIDHEDGLSSELRGEERGLDVGPVLVAVAHEQRVFGGEYGDRGQELWFAPHLETDARSAADPDELFHHVALLVHLDRKHAPVAPAVAVLLRRRSERRDQIRHPAGEEIGEADQERRTQTTRPQRRQEFVEIHPGPFRAVRKDLEVPLAVDSERAAPPLIHLIQLGAARR